MSRKTTQAPTPNPEEEEDAVGDVLDHLMEASAEESLDDVEPVKLEVVAIHRNYSLIAQPRTDHPQFDSFPAVIYNKFDRSFSHIETVGYFARSITFREPGANEKAIPVPLPAEMVEALSQEP